MNHILESIVVPDAPAIAGLHFRGFRGPEDFPLMHNVIEKSKDVDKQEFSESLEDLARNYEHLTNCDPYQDMLLVEMHGEVIGYSRVFWAELNLEGKRVYQHFTNLLPTWRGQGIRQAMLRYNEHRLRQIAAGHAFAGESYFEAWASRDETHWAGCLQAARYQPVRFGYEMVRPNLDDIPDIPLPTGLEVRPARPEDHDRIWYAAREAFHDHWGYSDDEWSEENWQQWQKNPIFQPHLWQAAWDGDEVAGMILNFIHEAENREYNRLRGYTETICVRRPWRRLGLARALLARSFHVLKAARMAEAALGVDAENPSGALQLYESMGFRVHKEFVTYRKPLA